MNDVRFDRQVYTNPPITLNAGYSWLDNVPATLFYSGGVHVLTIGVRKDNGSFSQNETIGRWDDITQFEGRRGWLRNAIQFQTNVGGIGIATTSFADANQGDVVFRVQGSGGAWGSGELVF